MKLIIIILFPLLLISFSAAGNDNFQDKKHKKEHKEEGSKPEQNVALLIEAKRADITGDKEKAERLFRQYIEKYPNDAVGYFELAQVLSANRHSTEAEELARQAVKIDPENVWYKLFLAEAGQVNGKYKEATGIYQELIEKNPEKLDYYYQLAALYLMQEEYNDAVKVYDRIEAIIGVTEEISLQKEKIFLQMNDLRRAQEELEKLATAFPDNAKYLAILAEFYMGTDKPDKALEIYKKISEVDPSNPYVFLSMADYYRKTGNREKAFENLKLGFANPALGMDTKMNILLTFFSVKDLYGEQKEQAFDLAKVLVKTHPNDPRSHSIYGDLLAQDKQIDSARSQFLQAIRLDSSKYVIWEEILQLDLQTNDLKSLDSHADQVISLFPEQPVPYLYSGLANYQLKNFPKAVSSYNRGLKMVVNNTELESQFHMYLGDSYHAMDQEEESDKHYQKSLDLKNDNAYVLNNFAYYLSVRNKDLNKAEEMAKKAVTIDPENPSFQDTYGWVLYKLGRFNEAKTWIAKALNDQEGPSAEVMEHYGDVLFKLGQTEEAYEYWKKAKAKGEGSKFLDKKIEEKKLVE